MVMITTTTKTASDDKRAQQRSDADWARQIAAVAAAGDAMAQELRQLANLWGERGGKNEDACPRLWALFLGSNGISAVDGLPRHYPSVWEMATAEWRNRGWLDDDGR
jgi:hypothetical protein